jgi:4-amino-4-deoxy-L-arabinose transferase-like glycosyltransferase
MSDRALERPLSVSSSRSRRRRDSARERLASLVRERWELLGLLVLAALLDLVALGQNGWANEYYSAAVRSMSTSWHNFLFASFDPSGVMTVDKPPLALWVQALSARTFGFSSWAILVPQALMGVATVALAYDLVRRRFGRLAGFAGGLALALTPITVAISRHNNPDALLALCCVAAVWFVVRGLEDGRTRWLVLAGVAVGLGFETKMAAALLVVPAIALAWFWVSPRGRIASLRQLLAGGAAMVAVGGGWPLLVTLTPASARPWISGTTDNSIFSLITGYNGVGRLAGQTGGPAGAGSMPGGGPGGNAGPFGGDSGPLRLLNDALGGQAGWLLGVAVVGLVGIAILSRMRRRDPRTGWLLAVGGSFATIAVAFSFAGGIFHPYYVAQLAPFTAMLVGATAGTVAGPNRGARPLAAVAILAGALVEIVVLSRYDGDLSWLTPLLVVVALAAAAAVAWGSPAVRRGALIAAATALLAAPAIWSVQTLGHATSGTFPAGGPASASSGFGGPGGGAPGGFVPGRAPGGFGGAPPQGGFLAPPTGAMPPMGVPGSVTPLQGGAATGVLPSGAFGGASGGGPPGAGGGFGAGVSDEILAYVDSHGGGTIAVDSQSGASSSIIDSGANVAGIGGFSGRESTVSVSWLANAVRDGRVRWVLVDSSGTGPALAGDTRTGSQNAIDVAASICKKVPAPKYSSGSRSTTAAAGSSSSATLYDCAGYADALAAAAS